MKKITLIIALLSSVYSINAQNIDSLNNSITSESLTSGGSMESLTTLTCSDAAIKWIPIANSYTTEEDLIPCEIGSVLIGVDPNAVSLPTGARLHTLATLASTVKKNIVLERETMGTKFALQLSTNVDGVPILNIGNNASMASAINITSTGNLGIGSYIADRKLDVVGEIRALTAGTNMVAASFAYSATRQVMVVPQLGASGYNPLSNANDFGVIWTDGGAGGNQNNTAGFFIGPHTGTTGRGLRIKSDGNVGIGGSNPAQKLDVEGSIRSSALAGTGNRMIIANSSGVLSSQAIPTGTQTLSWNSGTRVLGISGGNTVTIADGQTLSLAGTSLSISGGNSVTIPAALWTDQGGGNISTNNFVGVGIITPANAIELPNLNSPTGTGRAFAWITYSSGRWKENVNNLKNSIEIIKALRPVSFDWKKEHGGQADIGFIGEELGKVIPSAVRWEKEGQFVSGVDYTKAIPYTVAAIQLLEERVSSLEMNFEALQTKLAEATFHKEASINQFDGSFVTGQSQNSLSSGKLGQNIPNPFSKTTIIPFTLESDRDNVAIMVTDLTGKTLINLPVTGKKGENRVEINSSQLYQGIFIYHLSVSGIVIDSKRMVLKE